MYKELTADKLCGRHVLYSSYQLFFFFSPGFLYKIYFSILVFTVCVYFLDITGTTINYWTQTYTKNLSPDGYLLLNVRVRM
jgi:hypothetical protein